MTYRVPAHVHAREVHDEVVVLDARSNQYLGLNGTGAVVWSVLAAGGSADEAVDELVVRYEVGREVATSDVAALLDELLRLGLVTPASL
jgi:Coenzyme PQQ synthesis protein D (PqqD)